MMDISFDSKKSMKKFHEDENLNKLVNICLENKNKIILAFIFSIFFHIFTHSLLCFFLKYAELMQRFIYNLK